MGSDVPSDPAPLTPLLQTVHRCLTARADDEPVRFLAALAATLALAGTAAAATRAPQIDRGIVQSVSPTAIVLRELDGSTAVLAVGPATRVLVNGFRATLADVEPGFVARVTHNGEAPARAVLAFGRVQLTVTRGNVAAVSARALTVRTAGGENVTFRITARTKIRVRGLPTRLAAVRPGRVVDVTHTRGGEARRIAVRPALGRG